MQGVASPAGRTFQETLECLRKTASFHDVATEGATPIEREEGGAMTERESMRPALQSRGRVPRSGEQVPGTRRPHFARHAHCRDRGVREQGHIRIQGYEEGR